MLRALVIGLGIVCFVLWATFAAVSPSEKSHKLTSVSIRKMADSLHAVIAADRQAYVERVLQRWTSGENRREPWEVPSHAQLLRGAGQSIQQRGAEFSYALRSLWPINQSHGPQTQVEQEGLAGVALHPETPYYTEELLGGRSYFTAIYADRATLVCCVNCHNQHPLSPRHDFRTNDVMGAIVVRVPLEF